MANSLQDLLACFCYYLSHVVTFFDIKYFCVHADGGIEEMDKLAPNIVFLTEQLELDTKNWSKVKEHPGTVLLDGLGCESIADGCRTFLREARNTQR